MSLAQDLAQIPTGGRRANECSVCWILQQLSGPEAQAVNDALTGGASAETISTVLRTNGYDVSSDALRRHLKNGHVS